MPLESWGDKRPSSSRRSHRCNEHGIDDVSERMLIVLPIIPPSLINQLPQNFDWWLRSEDDFRHIEIIDEDNTPHTKSRSEVIPPPLVQLHVNDVLDLIAMSLSREPHLNDQPLVLLKFLEQNILDVGSFACTGRANKHGLNVVHDEKFLHETVSDSVNCGDDKLTGHRVFGELIDLVLVALIHPILPTIGLWSVAPVIDRASIESRR